MDLGARQGWAPSILCAEIWSGAPSDSDVFRGRHLNRMWWEVGVSVATSDGLHGGRDSCVLAEKPSGHIERHSKRDRNTHRDMETVVLGEAGKQGDTEEKKGTET